MRPFHCYDRVLPGTLHLSPEMTIAFSHGAFNVGNTIVQFPFIGALAYFVTKLIPGEDEVVKYEPLSRRATYPAISFHRSRKCQKNSCTWGTMQPKLLTFLIPISSVWMKR